MTRLNRAPLPLSLTVVAFVLLVCAPVASAMERVDLRDLSATRFSGMPTDDVAHDTRLYAWPRWGT